MQKAFHMSLNKEEKLVFLSAIHLHMKRSKWSWHTLHLHGMRLLCFNRFTLQRSIVAKINCCYTRYSRRGYPFFLVRHFSVGKIACQGFRQPCFLNQHHSPATFTSTLRNGDHVTVCSANHSMCHITVTPFYFSQLN